MKFTSKLLGASALLGYSAATLSEVNHMFELFSWSCQGNDTYSYEWDEPADAEFTMAISDIMSCLRGTAQGSDEFSADGLYQILRKADPAMTKDEAESAFASLSRAVGVDSPADLTFSEVNDYLATLDTEDDDTITQAEWTQLKMDLRENRQKKDPLKFAGDYRNFISSCGNTPVDNDEDLSMSFEQIDSCIASFSSSDGSISVDDWANWLTALGSYGEVESPEQSYRSMRKACKIKSSDMNSD